MKLGIKGEQTLQSISDIYAKPMFKEHHTTTSPSLRKRNKKIKEQKELHSPYFFF